jgi:hypothetical protein
MEGSLDFVIKKTLIKFRIFSFETNSESLGFEDRGVIHETIIPVYIC